MWGQWRKWQLQPSLPVPVFLIKYFVLGRCRNKLTELNWTESMSDKISKQKNSGKKHVWAPGVRNCRGKRYKGKEIALKQYYRKVTSMWNEISRNFGKIAGRFYIVFQMSKAREISNFQGYQSKFWDQYIWESWLRDVFILGKWYYCNLA